MVMAIPVFLPQSRPYLTYASRVRRAGISINRLFCTGVLEGHQGCVNAICFNEDGSLVASGSDDSLVKIWDLQKRKSVVSLRGHISNVFSTAFLPHWNNAKVLSGGNDADIRLFHLEEGTCDVYDVHRKKVLELFFVVFSAGFLKVCSPQGTSLVLISPLVMEPAGHVRETFPVGSIPFSELLWFVGSLRPCVVGWTCHS